MDESPHRKSSAGTKVRKAIRLAFIVWAAGSTLWLANSMRTRGVPAALLRSSATVTVTDRDDTLDFIANASGKKPGLIFFCGSGVAAEAYVPLLRPVADAGYSVFIVKLPYRFAPFDAHKRAALERAAQVIRSHPEIARWVIAGHSLGGALAARMMSAKPESVAGLVLIGTTHPKEADLSSLNIPVAKVFASLDGVAPRDRVLATKHLLPARTEWTEIEGGNHSQFGHYGHQLFDGNATISREAQQAVVRSVLLKMLAAAGGSDKAS